MRVNINQWKTTILKGIKFMKLLHSEKLSVFQLIWRVPGISGASSVIREEALTSHPVVLVQDADGRYREARHCIVYLPASVMRRV